VQVLGADVVPRIVEAARDSRAIRIWSAGCSSGEEPFSVAILLAEHLGDRANEYLVKIYGTDIDEEALATARHAVYRLDQRKDIPPELVDRYFLRDGQLYRIRRDVRRWCIFGAHNLTQAPPLSHIDLLVCRNVLIYFTSDLQDRILSRFHYAIREDGYLFLGRSESLLARSRLFRPLQLKWRIFQRTPSVPRQVAAVLPDREEGRGPTPGEVPARSEAGASTRAQRALDSLPAAIMIIDTTDTILAWNPAAELLFDIPAAAALARKFRDLDVSYRVEGLRARIEDVKARHAPTRMDNATFARRNGEAVHSDISILPLLEGYRLVGVLVFAVEATEHGRLKEQMNRVAEQHATAIEELQSTNEELETTNEELQSTNEELETTVEELQAANTELAALNAELEGRTTELNRLDTLHRSMVDSLEQPLVVLDRGGAVTTWNHAAEHAWSLRAEHALNRPFFSLPVGDGPAQTRPHFERILATGESVEIPGVRPPGNTAGGVLRMAPMRSPRGDVIGAIATFVADAGSRGRK
jgi:two-component system CheB/CheR fusion protein